MKFKSFISAVLLTASFFLSGIYYSEQLEAADLPITSNFGWRFHPISGEWSFHAGLDLGYDTGTPVAALFAGLVLQAGDYRDGYGNQVLIHHPVSDTFTRYGHLNTVYVYAGQYVSEGEIIGLVGSSGYSTGPHLHLEYIVPNLENGGYIYTDPIQLWP